MVMSVAEGASLQAGFVAQQGVNAAANATATVAGVAASGAIRASIAAGDEVSMALSAAGASSNVAGSAGAATTALAPAAAAEFTTGLISGAAGVDGPATSITNQLGSEIGASFRELRQK